MDIYIDGSSMGNPGDAGVGIIFQSGDHTIKNISRYIGIQTNNVAEYTALVFALEEALIMKAKDITVYSDSELLCKQLSGEYKVKNESLKVLFAQAVNLVRRFQSFKIHQIPREKNRGADKQARLAIKKKITKIDGVATLSAFRGGEESPSSKGQRSG